MFRPSCLPRFSSTYTTAFCRGAGVLGPRRQLWAYSARGPQLLNLQLLPTRRYAATAGVDVSGTPNAGNSSSRPSPIEPLVVFSFNPGRIEYSSFVDFANLQTAKVSVYLPSMDDVKSFEVSYHQEKHPDTPHDWSFPPNTRGYLYYHAPPGLPLSSSHIRFRIVNDAHTSFWKGRDLLSPTGLPWAVPLLSVVHLPTLAAIRDKLLDENLITLPQLARLAQIAPPAGLKETSVMIHALNQPFPIVFDKENNDLWIVGRKEVRQLPLRHLLYDRRTGPDSNGAPYSGAALACFERSTLPEHAETPTLCLRIAKIIYPVQVRIPGYDGHIPVPMEGELLRRDGIWSYSIDNESGGGALELLLDNEAGEIGGNVSDAGVTRQTPRVPTVQPRRISSKIMSSIIQSLHEPFLIAFHRSTIHLRIKTSSKESIRVTIQHMYSDLRSHPAVSPYSGTALVRFELSKFPEHASTRTLVMRILNFIDPLVCVIPNYDGAVAPPVEGALVIRSGAVWTCDVDDDISFSHALRLLVDNQPTPLIAPPVAAAVMARAILRSSDDLFPVRFSRERFPLRIKNGTTTSSAHIRGLFSDYRQHTVNPYTGLALARFERSTLPEHAGSRTLVIRLVEIVEPPGLLLPNYDGHIPLPRAGELVLRGQRAWACDVDRDQPMSHFLRPLADGLAQPVPQRPHRPDWRTITLRSLHEPFSLSVGASGVVVHAGGRARLQKVFYDGRAGAVRAPYAGIVQVCFERSTLSRHAGTRTLVMRILEILEPVRSVVADYDEYVPVPTKGELVMRGNGVVWNCNIDDATSTVAKALKVLWNRWPEAARTEDAMPSPFVNALTSMSLNGIEHEAGDHAV